MSSHVLKFARGARPTRSRLAHAWRNWWMRGAKMRQRQRLNQALTDPHLARDLGLPVIERPHIRPELW